MAHPTTWPRTLTEAFQKTAAANPTKLALIPTADAAPVTWGEWAARAEKCAGGLAALGVQHGDTVGIMLTNRPEFHIVDAAAMHLGAAAFSVYNTNPAEVIAHQFGNAGNRVVITEKAFLPIVRAAISQGGQVEHVVVIDGDDTDAGSDVITLAQLESSTPAEFDFAAAWQAVQPDDVLTIIYTSGTTGMPKGVELTHNNLISNIRGTAETLPQDLRVLSYLPDAHIVNRYLCQYAPMLLGGEVHTLANGKLLVDALKQVRPTFFVGVPQVWYKVKAGIEAKLAAEEGAKGRLVNWAVDTGKRFVRHESDGTPVPGKLAFQHKVAEKLLHKIREAAGLDQLFTAFTGAAPIAPEALEYIAALGVPIIEGWGMSEVSAVATFNRHGHRKFGTVGPATPGIQIALAEDGEVLVKGPSVMPGYRGDAEKTAETIDADGWLHTGDIGVLDEDSHLRIVDRKKEIIISTGGKNMSPSQIEGALRVALPILGAAVAIGDARPYITALLTLDPDAAAAFAAKHGIANASIAELSANSLVREHIEAGVAAANKNLSKVEQVQYWSLLPTTWEPGGDELTPTMKLKRGPITSKYSDVIESNYSR
ncbi:AMP-dependent synthetase [Knoellia sinensis KCTC 19936]|uniref:Acyl-CoA synthetase n=1 Tax=Knoellia sinensis KCTC 19936 TaxID=1385520 RepID=A0A0A0J437_9MICO|nr:long-chain fatty acid--CoA ligase [Knoellia sinensis]KGN32110.1 AMP-dependent synthetase [Knoellia sinensis KCTC 19936]